MVVGLVSGSNSLQLQQWHVSRMLEVVKALVWFWLIDETLSANLVYQGDYEIGSTTPSDETMTKIMTMVTAW